MDGKSFYKTKFNDSLWDNSKIKIQNNNYEMNDLFNLNINNIKKRSKGLDDSNYLMSRVFQNSSSLSSSSPNNSPNNLSNNNNYNIIINRSFKKGSPFSRSYKENNNNRDIEILNNNINIITINKNRSNSRNRLSLLRKLETNLNNINNIEKKSNNENENNENNINNNQNIKTTELMLNNDISQYKVNNS